MKRFHVHVGVENLEESIRFYSGLFGTSPTVHKPDYAKWMMDQPRVNFAISQRSGARVGVNHLGIQAESADELAGIRDRFEAADASSVVDEPGVNCCYAKGNKHWVTDPQGIAWEAFHTLEAVPYYGDATEATAEAGGSCGTTAASTSMDLAQQRAGGNCCGAVAFAASTARAERPAGKVCCG